MSFSEDNMMDSKSGGELNPVDGNERQADSPPSVDSGTKVPATSAKSSPKSPVEQIQNQALESTIVEVIKTIYDPEIPVNIYELGLIYEIEIVEEGRIAICMTLTSPACPVAGSLVTEVEQRVRSIDGIDDCRVDLVWDPPWTPDKLSEAARLQLNL